MATRSPRAPLTAFVLHRYDWSESSVILDVFTREQGRLAVAAKGAKKPYSNFRSVLLPFQRIHVGFVAVGLHHAVDIACRDRLQMGLGSALVERPRERVRRQAAGGEEEEGAYKVQHREALSG